MAARTVSSIVTASVAAHRPAPLRQNAWEPTFTVWMDVTALTVGVCSPHTSLLMHTGLIFRFTKLALRYFGISPSNNLNFAQMVIISREKSRKLN